MGSFKNNYVAESALEDVKIPLFVRIKQNFSAQRVENIPCEIQHGILKRQLNHRINPGQRIAVAVGSRQIANIVTIIQELIRLIRKRGATPYLIPAMGSHGAAAAEGQRAILEDFGLTEAAMGVQIISSMEVAEIGRTQDNTQIFVDKNLLEFDGIILVNKIKPHPAISGPIESGLTKMSVIGLGKQKGAETCHRLGLKDMSARLIEMSRVIVRKLPVIFGVGIIENSNDEIAEVHCIPAELIESEEPALLNKARSIAPKILLNPLDVLVIDEAGKNISGVGADPMVMERYVSEFKIGERQGPARIMISDMTKESKGAANGMGQADVITRRFYNKIDFGKSYINAMSSTFLVSVKMPVVMKNDLYALKFAIKTCNCVDQERVRIARIKNTLQIREMWISESLVPEAVAHPQIEVLSEASPLAFTNAGYFKKQYK